MTSNECMHSDVRVIPDPDVLMAVGVEVCAACRARRLVDGNHDGPWVPEGEKPYWHVEGERADPSGGEHKDNVE